MITGSGARPVPSSGGSGVRPDRLRLLAKVAHLYHERGLRQPQIAEELHISQSRVSRLLRQAVETGIVRTVVTLPGGVHTDLEDQLRAAYGLQDAVVVDVDGSSGDTIRSLGGAGAVYLEETLGRGDVIGISSWSSTLLAVVDAMRPIGAGGTGGIEVVAQLLGGIGDPKVQMQANRLIGRLCELTGAQPLFMPTPSLVSTPALRRAVTKDAAVSEVMTVWERLTIALLGIGSLQPSPLLQGSGNGIALDEQAKLRDLGGVGDVALRFFDATGQRLASALDERVIGIAPAALKRIPRRIGVAGGPAKYSAIRATLLGDWITILITDLTTARQLLADAEAAAPQR